MLSCSSLQDAVSLPTSHRGDSAVHHHSTPLPPPFKLSLISLLHTPPCRALSHLPSLPLYSPPSPSRSSSLSSSASARWASRAHRPVVCERAVMQSLQPDAPTLQSGASSKLSLPARVGSCRSTRTHGCLALGTHGRMSWTLGSAGDWPGLVEESWRRMSLCTG